MAQDNINHCIDVGNIHLTITIDIAYACTINAVFIMN
jgi:hypothetical protein